VSEDWYRELIVDLAAERADLRALVGPLPDEAWDAPTPAPGWAVRDVVYHLAFFDDAAADSILRPEEFARHKSAMAARRDPAADHPAAAAARTPGQLLGDWDRAHGRLLEGLGRLGGRERVEWYGPQMSAGSFATARLMETWAHGQDVVDALELARPPSDRIRHIVHLGVITRGWTFANRGLAPDDTPVLVELTSPSGQPWTWGPEDAADRVEGTALDFALVVTQRRNVADTGLAVTGEAAARWMAVAQCFAGPATERAPRHQPAS